MTTKSKWPGALLAVAITLNAGDVRAQDQERQQLTSKSAVTVNDLAGKPGEYLGQVQLSVLWPQSCKDKALCSWTSASMPIVA